ncbi:hypothetical protein KC19_2G173600 [Ceratodon purpureus]|uniref:Uncharacterized protein n=1 Tax=Ceratodon purpureus TaxID=3225 RepID=A0A8T0IXC8_CERPU|nr:hypothetical protein KC19_2G173600 [Ceratodon purpureus]
MSRRAFTEKAIASEDVLRKTTRSARNVKHESIVAGEAAGRGIPGRVQCRDGSLKNGSDTEMDGRRLVRDRPCLVSEKETVSFATLFVVPEADAVETYSSEQIEVKERTRGKRIQKDKLDAVLRSFLESIQVSMPGTTEVTIITNQNKEKRELPQNAVWKPSTREFARGNLMVQRLESYIDFLEDMIEKRKNSSAYSITHVIFSDFDMIVVDDLGCAFETFVSFDVALTFRNNQRQPINSGVIMIRGTLESLTRGKNLLKKVVEVYRAKFSHAFGVLGDQLALADVVKGTVQAARAFQGGPFEAPVMAAKTLFLPCSIYNWTPSEGAGQFHGMPTEVKVRYSFSIYCIHEVITNILCILRKLSC